MSAMINKMNDQKRSEPSSKDSLNDDISFTLFDISEADLGLGVAISPDNYEVLQPDEPTSPCIQLPVPEDEAKIDQHNFSNEGEETGLPINPLNSSEPQESTGLRIYTADDNETPANTINFEQILEQSKSRFEEFKSGLENFRILDTYMDPSKKIPDQSNRGSLTIEADVSDGALLINDFEQLEEMYREQTTPVKELVVEVDKTTATDRAGKAISWIAETFVVSPTRWISRQFHNGIKELFSFLGGVIKVVLVATFLTTVLSVFYVHRVDPSLEVSEIPLQTYTVIKQVVINLYSDLINTRKNIMKR
ncbi:hypothetical protein [Paenibacillus sp. DMB5]|uniref:hypothetical protein n=1 Tax=Paenibacillus sp. DMB5 TaxID=1780103 RepID=UPI00076C335F|nr:hypothetical protein [Paenibacillus sp. DMB5]KUP22045.1 hypothetical protein AWJ19_21280 [Paenibacillus sp. DMB5]